MALVGGVNQVALSHDEHPKLLALVSQRRRDLCKNRTPWGIYDRHDPSCRTLARLEYRDLGAKVTGYAAYMTDLVRGLEDRGGGPCHRCEMAVPFHQNLYHLALDLCHCHDMKTQYRELEDLRSSTLPKEARLASCGGHG